MFCQIWFRLPVCALFGAVQVRIASIIFACTRNALLVTVYYIVYFYLLLPKKNLVQGVNRPTNISSCLRVMVDVNVEVML